MLVNCMHHPTALVMEVCLLEHIPQLNPLFQVVPRIILATLVARLQARPPSPAKEVQHLFQKGQSLVIPTVVLAAPLMT